MKAKRRLEGDELFTFGEVAEIVPGEERFPVAGPGGFVGRAWKELEDVGRRVPEANDRVTPEGSADLEGDLLDGECCEVRIHSTPWYHFFPNGEGLVVQRQVGPLPPKSVTRVGNGECPDSDSGRREGL